MFPISPGYSFIDVSIRNIAISCSADFKICFCTAGLHRVHLDIEKAFDYLTAALFVYTLQCGQLSLTQIAWRLKKVFELKQKIAKKVWRPN